MALSWGYQETNGPQTWHKEFPVAEEGKRQSPINIVTDDVVDATADVNKNPLKWTYTDKHCLSVENTGSSWRVNIDGSGSTLTGGPLSDDYELWQYHAHWGKDDSLGSEHKVNGQSYAGELHLVHWNRSKYPSPNVAAGHGDGLAVLGVLLEVKDGEEHPELAKLVPYIDKIPFCGNKVTISEQMDPTNFIPNNPKMPKRFWTYQGSLTTPPLLESVIWIVFQQPLKISKQQIEVMRNLKCNDQEAKSEIMMVDNFRPTCPLKARCVKGM